MPHLFGEPDVLLRITHPADEIRSGYKSFARLVDIIHDLLQFVFSEDYAKLQHCIFEFLAIKPTRFISIKPMEQMKQIGVLIVGMLQYFGIYLPWN